jgi:hypothetical protein
VGFARLRSSIPYRADNSGGPVLVAAMESNSMTAPLDAEWVKIGLGSVARRTLVEAKLYRVSDLRRVSLAELTALHGMGKSTIARLRQIMVAKKMQFRE